LPSLFSVNITMEQDTRLSELVVNIHRQKGVYALLLGSGLSSSASILTGWKITLDLIRQLAAPSSSECSEKELCDWYRKEYQGEPDYSRLLEQIAQTESERRGILENYFEPTEAEREEGKNSLQKYIRPQQSWSLELLQKSLNSTLI
jgi:hypothetical protein